MDPPLVPLWVIASEPKRDRRGYGNLELPLAAKYPGSSEITSYAALGIQVREAGSARR